MTSTSRTRIPSSGDEPFLNIFLVLFGNDASCLAAFNQSSCGSSLTDVSLKDWDIKEQENLREVEEILERTDEILEVSCFSEAASTHDTILCQKTEGQKCFGTERRKCSGPGGGAGRSDEV